MVNQTFVINILIHLFLNLPFFILQFFFQEYSKKSLKCLKNIGAFQFQLKRNLCSIEDSDLSPKTKKTTKKSSIKKTKIKEIKSKTTKLEKEEDGEEEAIEEIEEEFKLDELIKNIGSNSDTDSESETNEKAGSEKVEGMNEKQHTISISVYNQFIKACIESEEYLEATKILLQMPKQGFLPSTALYNLVMTALSQKGMMEEIKELYKSMNEHGIAKNKRTVTTVLDAGKLSDLTESDRELLGETKTIEETENENENENTKIKPKRRLFFKDKVKDIAVHDKKLKPLDLEKEEEEDQLEEDYFEHLTKIVSSSQRIAFSKQIQLESRAITDSVEKYNESIKNLVSIKKGASLSPGQRILLHWFGPISTAISDFQRKVALKAKEEKESNSPALLLTKIDSEKLAVIAMHEVLSFLLAKPTGAKYTKIAIEVGNAVQAELNSEKLKNEKSKLFKKMKEDGSLWNVRSVLKKSKAVFRENTWSMGLCAKIGGYLIEILLDHAYISKSILDKNFGGAVEDIDRKPAFIHFHQQDGKKKQGMLKLDEEVVEVIDMIHVMQNCVHARYLPMLVPPRPWSTPKKGGYLTISSSIMRYKGSHLQNILLEEANDLSKIYSPLNILGSTAWTINNQLYDVINEAWKSGGGIGELPTHSNIDIPAPPDFETFVTEKNKWYFMQKKIKQLNWDRHGLRCETNYKLAVAHEFQNVPFYFPHNVDFRGRAYPIPPYLNQMGNDLCRSLLFFHKGMPLGKSGLNWLKIHLSNLCGNNKISFDDRLKFVNENLENVLDSANKPLTGNRWWLKAEEPWQCLATCFEIKKALDCNNIEEYVCHLPVHQDGSCNGLQHYAALGKFKKFAF